MPAGTIREYSRLGFVHWQELQLQGGRFIEEYSRLGFVHWQEQTANSVAKGA